MVDNKCKYSKKKLIFQLFCLIFCLHILNWNILAAKRSLCMEVIIIAVNNSCTHAKLVFINVCEMEQNGIPLVHKQFLSVEL